MKRTIIKALIFFHVTTLLIAVFHLNNHFPRHKFFYPVKLAYTFYHRITYNNIKFPFFAPSVKKQYTSKIICTNAAGNKFEFAFPIPNAEIALRSKKIAHNLREEKKRSAVINSLTKYIQSHHPDVKTIDISLFENDLPTMEQARKGAKASVKLFYQKTISV